MRRRDFLKGGLAAGGGLLGGSLGGQPLRAEGRSNALLTVSEGAANSLDSHTTGSNRGAFEVSWNIYDRLLSYGVKTDENGVDHYDYTTLVPELAEEWDLQPMSCTFKLRRNAVFHDGSKVTAQDVKWSFDRAISVGGFPRFQLGAGSLTDTEQFVVVDDRTFRIDFKQHDKLTMPILGVPVGIVLNSTLVRGHATAADPWGLNWTKNNGAGGGAYRVASQSPGQEFVFVRNDAWKSGPLPKLERIIWRVVPSAATRRALLERGDADISIDLPPRDAAEMANMANLKIVGTPVENALQYIGMNVTIPPFDDVRVRLAVAYAIPYQRIMEVALYGRARPLFGGPSAVTTPEWPQPHRYATDLDRARQLLSEAGHANGFETTLSYDLGAAVVNEPLCLLVQESLGKIGIKVTLDKIPGSNWRAAFTRKTLPLITNVFGGWLNYPDYFFHWAYDKGVPFNTMAYDNPKLDALIKTTRFETDPAKYAAEVEECIRIVYDDVPRVPLYQPYLNVAMQKNVQGYRYWFHRQLDYRTLTKA
ncbi:MAG TPA: ABC transporter substrate-binding protein [Pseudolabrys sp.]